MARNRRIGLASIPLLVVGLMLFGLFVSPARGQGEEPTSSCEPGLRKWAEPLSVLLGEPVSVTLGMTSTCEARMLPMDVILLVDESPSMTRSNEGSGDLRTPIAKPTEPDPRETPGGDPTDIPPEPPEPPDEPPGPGDPGPPGGGGGGQVGGRDYDPCLYIGPQRGGNGPGDPAPTGNPGDPGGPPRPTEPGPVNTATPTREGRPEPTKDPGPGNGGREGYEEEPAGGEDLIREAQGLVTDFLDRDEVKAMFDDGTLRMGVVAFNDRARVLRGLSDDPSQVRSAMSRLRPGGGTKIRVGMQMAQNQLRDTRGDSDSDRVKMIIVLSDGEFCIRDVGRSASGRDEIRVVTIGLGRLYQQDPSLLRQVASDAAYALDQRDLQELVFIFTDVVPVHRTVNMSTLTIRDTLTEQFEYIDGSANPAPSKVDGQTLEWSFDPAVQPVTITYGVRPLEGGTHFISDNAAAEWVDSESLPGAGDFPNVEIEVALPTPTPTFTSTPTPTPTSTNTPTPTATPIPQPAFLPWVANRWPEPPVKPTPVCEPSVQTVDVAIVIDTSTSMSETTGGGVTKIDAAIDAGLGFVDLLKFPDQGVADQVTVIGFNDEAQLALPLSPDKAAIQAALQNLAGMQEQGTRINRGLDAAYEQLVGPSHRSENNRAIILVTDGFQTGVGATNQEVIDAANRAKAENITVWTVGLGSSVDADLLRDAATSPDHFKLAPTAEGLRLIYEEIARLVPCD